MFISTEAPGAFYLQPEVLAIEDPSSFKNPDYLLTQIPEQLQERTKRLVEPILMKLLEYGTPIIECLYRGKDPLHYAMKADRRAKKGDQRPLSDLYGAQIILANDGNPRETVQWMINYYKIPAYYPNGVSGYESGRGPYSDPSFNGRKVHFNGRYILEVQVLTKKEKVYFESSKEIYRRNKMPDQPGPFARRVLTIMQLKSGNPFTLLPLQFRDTEPNKIPIKGLAVTSQSKQTIRRTM